MADLEKCPFCGGIGSLWSSDKCKTFHAVCLQCGTRTKDCNSREEAITTWNSRRYRQALIKVGYGVYIDVELIEENKTNRKATVNRARSSEIVAEFIDVNRLRRKLLERKWNANTRTEIELINSFIDIVELMPVTKISGGINNE